MPTPYTSHLDRMGTPRWLQSLLVTVLALTLFGMLAVIVLVAGPSFVHERRKTFAALCIICLVGLIILVRLFFALARRSLKVSRKESKLSRLSS